MRYTARRILGLSLMLAAGAVQADAIESELQRLQFTEAAMAKVGAADLDGFSWNDNLASLFAQ